MANWLVMLYLAGADDLEPCMAQTMQQLEKVGAPTEVEVIVQLARAPSSLIRNLLPDRSPTEIDGDWHGVRRYRLCPRPDGASDRAYHSELLAELRLTSIADPNALADFVTYGNTHFPAERSMLVISGHGMGFVGLTLDLVTQLHPVVMSIRGMAAALRGLARALDVILLDACQMNCLEVACQLALPRPVAHWLITPASHAPRGGLDYPKLLSTLGTCGAEPTADITVRIAAALQSLAGIQVLSLQLDPALWRSVTTLARGATGATDPPMFLAAARACKHPPAGSRMSFLVHWPLSPHFPERYHHLYQRLWFARQSRWSQMLGPVIKGESLVRSVGPLPAPGPLLFAWLRLLRADLKAKEVVALMTSVGWTVD